MEALPEDWIAKLFDCMAEWYGERWTRILNKPHIENYLQVLWKNGLAGLTYNEIKFALKLCKRHAADLSSQPPHVMEFFRYAKGYSQPDINYHPKAGKTGDPQIASKYLDEIKQKLGMTAKMEVYARLGK